MPADVPEPNITAPLALICVAYHGSTVFHGKFEILSTPLTKRSTVSVAGS